MSAYEFEYFMEELIGSMIGYNLFINIFSWAFSIAGYVLTSLGLYTIAQRRGISKPWLSWVPIGNLWIIGSISDQYRYVVKGEQKNKRKILLILNIIVLVIALIIIFGMIMIIIGTAGNAVSGGMSDAEIMTVIFSFLGLFLLYFPMMGVAIACAVVQYMAMYDLYTSCDPSNNVLLLVLSIIFGVTQPFFIFFNRNKDLGMPPRKQEPCYYIPYQQQCYQQPQYAYPPQQEQPQYAYPPQQEQPRHWQVPQEPEQPGSYQTPEA